MLNLPDWTVSDEVTLASLPMDPIARAEAIETRIAALEALHAELVAACERYGDLETELEEVRKVDAYCRDRSRRNRGWGSFLATDLAKRRVEEHHARAEAVHALLIVLVVVGLSLPLGLPLAFICWGTP